MARQSQALGQLPGAWATPSLGSLGPPMGRGEAIQGRERGSSSPDGRQPCARSALLRTTASGPVTGEELGGPPALRVPVWMRTAVRATEGTFTGAGHPPLS